MYCTVEAKHEASRSLSAIEELPVMTCLQCSGINHTLFVSGVTSYMAVARPPRLYMVMHRLKGRLD